MLRISIFVAFVSFLANYASAQVYQAWVHRYAGPSYDAPQGSALDREGNILLCGAATVSSDQMGLVYKLDPSGNRRWAVYDDRGSYVNAVAADAEGNVITLLTGRRPIVIVKYSPAGVALWSREFVRDGYQDGGDGCLVALSNGSILVGFNLNGSVSRTDIFVLKYDATGDLLWTVTYDGAAHGYDGMIAMAADGQGAAYFAGQTESSPGEYDALVGKVRADGQLDWTRAYSGPASESDVAYDIALDSAGSILTCGSVDRTAYYTGDMLTLKYSPTGELQWARRNDGGRHGADSAYALCVGPDDGVIVVGEGNRTDGSGGDWTVLSYDSQGQQRWAEEFDGPAGGYDRAYDVVADEEGNGVVAGFVTAFESDSDGTIVKYSPAGERLWSMSYNGPANQNDAFVWLHRDAAGSCYATGQDYGIETGADFVTVKYVEEPACSGSERLKADCFFRCRDGMNRVEALLKSALPAGMPVSFLLDNAQVFTTQIKRNGRAKAKWSNVETDVHTVRVEPCGIEQQTNCCG